MTSLVPKLDLSGLAQFKASDLLAEASSLHAIVSAPVQVDLALIDFDPTQPRRTLVEATIAELAQSIALHGVVEPVSLRSQPESSGRYIVNRGERRVRAARLAGLATVPAVLDERADPYLQAAENLHREDMSPFDLAYFVRDRELEGASRSEIARRLNKPRSFVTSVAALIDAPSQVQEAFASGRVRGVRALYQLTVGLRQRPEDMAALLAGGDPIKRSAAGALLSGELNMDTRKNAASPASVLHATEGELGKVSSGGRTVLVVEHDGRHGSLRLKAQDRDLGEVRFGDGSRSLIQLKELRPIRWACEE